MNITYTINPLKFTIFLIIAFIIILNADTIKKL